MVLELHQSDLDQVRRSGTNVNGIIDALHTLRDGLKTAQESEIQSHVDRLGRSCVNLMRDPANSQATLHAIVEQIRNDLVRQRRAQLRR